ALEVVLLHDAGEALALAGADDVDLLARSEHVDSDLLAEGVFRRVVGPHLDEVAARRHARLAEVPGLRLVHPARVDNAIRKLDGGIAIDVRSPDLRNNAWSGLDDGDRNDPARV